jgi:Co/Zn/Cd efflux system component
MLNDAIVYTVSLLMVARSAVCKARAALGSGIAMLALAAFVFVQGIDKALDPRVPDVLLLEAGALSALAGNALCCRLLARHREDDVAMASAWLCSRNDILANVLIVIAGVVAHVSGSQWPDLAVGLAIATLFARSGLEVIAGARRPRLEASPRAVSLGATP